MVFKAIFFDAAGTLIKTTRPVGESYARVAQRFGMEVLPGQLTERFRDSREKQDAMFYLETLK